MAFSKRMPALLLVSLLIGGTCVFAIEEEAFAPSPQPEESPALPASPTPPDNTKLLDCPTDGQGLAGGFKPVDVGSDAIQQLATDSWNDIVSEGATGNRDENCDLNDPSKVVITPTGACGQVVAGQIYIIHYSVWLTSCNQIAKVKANVLDPLPVNGDTPELNAFEVSEWVAGPSPSPSIPSPSPQPPSPSPQPPSPSPQPPSPSPTPPPKCIYGEPACRWIVEDAVCFGANASAKQAGGITTSKTYAYAKLVCNEWANLPAPSCWAVEGPENVTVTPAGIGATTLSVVATYKIDWSNTTLAGSNGTLPYNGSVTLSMVKVNETNSEACQGWLGQRCLWNMTAYDAFPGYSNLTINVYNPPQGYYNALANSTQLGLLDSIAYHNLTDVALGGSGCLMQTMGALNETFYAGDGAVTYNEGFVAQGSWGVGSTCTVTP